MPDSPLQMEGWDIGLRREEWLGFGLHPCQRRGTNPMSGAFWVSNAPADAAAASVWRDRMALVRSWRHPAVHRVEEAGLWLRHPWAITSPVRQSSRWAFRTHVPLHFAEAAVILRQALSGLVFAHDQGIFHGGIGPNALYLEGGTWRFAGLGFVDLGPGRVDPRVGAALDLRAVAGLVPLLLGAGAELTLPLALVVSALEAGEGGLALERLEAAAPAPTTTPPSAPLGEPPRARLAAGEGPPVSSPSAPRQLGRYTLLEKLAQGGQGVVWRAHDPELDRFVAVKVQHPEAMLPDDALARFRQEARAAARLDHRAIVRVLDFGNTPQGLFFAMELVEGVDLSRRLRELGRVEPRMAAHWVAEVARALAHAHREGIVHRDLKPANIMLEGDQQPRLTDFGLALAVNAGERLTRAGDVMGTPSYMAPEQAAGRLDLIGPRSDIYSLGVVLYELVSGRRPVRDGPLATVIFDLVYKSPVPLRTLVPDAPPDIFNVVERAMALQPEDRYPNMDAFADDLEHFLAGEPVVARAPSWLARSQSWVRRHRSLSIAAVSALGVSLVLGGVGAAVAARRAEGIAQREAEAARRVASAEAAIGSELSEGDAAGAQRLFAELVADPDIQGTTAWSDAWLAEGERRAQAGDNAGERDALGRVWLNAQLPGVRRLAMTRLAGSWRREQRYDRVAMVLDALAREGDGTLQSSAVSTLLTEASLFRWHTEGVVHPAAALVAALASRTPIALDQEDVRLEAVVGGGHPAVLRSRHSGMAWRLHADGSTEALPAPPAGAALQRFFRIASGPELRAVATTPDAVLLLRLDSDWVEEGRVELPGPHELALVELDAAAPSLIIAHSAKREALMVERDAAGRWMPSAPLWSGRALNSDLGGATAVDLDGDGTRELAVALGAWQAYDLRLLDRAAGGVRIRDRVRLGYVRSPRGLSFAGAPALVVGSTDAYTDPRMFSNTQPLKGMAVLTLNPSGLQVAQRIELVGGCDIVGAGDADGDRLDDVLATCNGLAVFARQVGSRFAAIAVSGLELHGAADLDGDGDLEVVATETLPTGSRLVIAGAKGEVRAPDPQPVLDIGAVPEGLSARDAERWRREEVLVGLGLNQTALGWLGASQDTTGASLLRRARLEQGADRFEEAVDSAVAAIRAGALEAAAVGVEAALLAGDPQAARDVLLAAPNTASEELRKLAARPRETIDLEAELTSRWRIADPSVLRYRPHERALHVDMVGAPEVARLPLVTDGHGVRVEVQLDTEVVEWDGGLEFSLETPQGDAAYVQLWLRGEGGGGAVSTIGNVRFRGGKGGRVRLGGERRIAASPAELKLTAALGGGRVRARMELNGETALSISDRVEAVDVPTAGRLDLVIRGWSDSSDGARLVGRIRRVVVDGARVTESEVPSEEDLAITELVNGRAERALELLRPFSTPRSERARMAALLDLGRAEEATELYRRLLAEQPFPASARGPLRARPRWAVQTLRGVLGAGWLAPTWDTWAAPLAQHSDDPDLARDFMSWAEDIGPLPAGGAEWAALDHAEATLHVALLARSQGRLTQAEGLASLAAQGVAGEGAGATAVRRALTESRAAVELASIAAVRGTEAEVERHLAAALAAHPAPEALAERLTVDPVFQPYVAANWWRQLVEEYRRFGARSPG